MARNSPERSSPKLELTCTDHSTAGQFEMCASCLTVFDVYSMTFAKSRMGQLLAQDSCMVVKSIAAKWVAWHVFSTMMVTTDHTLGNVRLQSPITQRPLVAARTKIKGAWRA